MIRAVFWDFDGLILDTESPEVVSWRETYSSFGVVFPDRVWQEMIGQSGDDLSLHPVKVLEQMLGRPLDRDKVRADNLASRHRLIALEEPMPGVVERLNEAERLSLISAVVSSSSREWVETHLSRLELLDRFRLLKCREDGLPSKPAPDLYLSALVDLDLEPEEVVVFEDSPRGIEAAKEAGLLCFAVPNQLTTDLDLGEADMIVPGLDYVTLEGLFRQLGLSLAT